MSLPYDALLVVSFGGPEGPDDVIPFLENVLRGKPVPRKRMLEVAEHYQHFGGVSPINAQTRDLIAALTAELERAGIEIPIYWGNRNWRPLLPTTVRQMADDGIRRALAFVVSAYSSYSGCRQYRENIEAARAAVGAEAPVIDKLRVFYNHPGFVEANAEQLRRAVGELPTDRRMSARVLFTAHSIPLSMVRGCAYERQLLETCRLVAESADVATGQFELVYQSRSGRPQEPWLEPDVLDRIRALHGEGVRDVVLCPVGFLSDHIEVLYDLDTEAKDLAASLGMNLVRAATVGSHPLVIAMIRELIEERLGLRSTKSAVGAYGPNHDVCPVDCCLYPR